jgi:phytoene dehydrogenase-like protein
MGRIITLTLEMAGCPVVKGGGYRLVQAFEQLIRAHGGELVVNADVERVISENGVAKSVRTSSGNEYSANKAIICSVTPGQLYQRLLEPKDVPTEVMEQTRTFHHGNADMQIHLALREPQQWCHPDLNNVALLHLTAGTDAVSGAVNQAERGLLPDNATIVVGQPAVLDPSRVPEGKGILWIQLQELPKKIKGDAAGEIATPSDGKWNDRVKEAYADRIVERLRRHIPNLKDNIMERTVLSPADLEKVNINLVGGDPYGGACSLDQFFLWRPLRALKNHETPLKNLYHIGASTHPGPGLGGGSGYLVAKAL